MGAKIWYLTKGKKKVGPLSAGRIARGVEGGKVPPGTMAWREGMDTWMPVAEIPELYGVDDDSGQDRVDSGSDLAGDSAVGIRTRRKPKKKRVRVKKKTRRSRSEGRVEAAGRAEEAWEPPTRTEAKKKPEKRTEQTPKSEEPVEAKSDEADAGAQPQEGLGPLVPMVLGTLGITVAGVVFCLGLVAVGAVSVSSMGSLAAAVVVFGLIALGWGGMQAFKAGRLSKTPCVKTGEAASQDDAFAGPRGAISTEGQVRCDELLISPVSGTPCLYYELTVVGHWKEEDSNKSQEYESQKGAAVFGLDDGTGLVSVDATEGGDIEPLTKTFDETKKEGFLAAAAGAAQTIQFGEYEFQNPRGSKAESFTCVERVLEPQDQLFVLGRAEEGRITAPKWCSMIVSNRSRDELLGSTQQAARRFLIGGAIVLAIGIIVGLTSSLVSSAKEGELSAAPTQSAVRL